MVVFAGWEDITYIITTKSHGRSNIYLESTERLALENEAKLLSEIQKQTIDSLSEEYRTIWD